MRNGMGIRLGMAGVVAGLLWCAGCARPPGPVSPPIDAPEAWSSEGIAGEVVSGWLSSFKDRELEAWVDRVMADNPELEGRWARLQAAGASARVQGARQWPEIALGGDGSRSRDLILPDQFGAPDFFPDGAIRPEVVRYGVALDISWELDLWGRIRAGQSAVLADLQAAGFDTAGFRLSLAGQTAKAWFSVAELREQLQLALEVEKSFEATANLVESRYQNGLARAADLRLARSSHASAQALVEQRRQELGRALRQLETLAGRYPEGRAEVARRLPAVPPPPPSGLPSELLYRRPDLMAAERRIAATDQRLREARLALLPRIRLSGSGGRSSDGLGDLLDSNFTVWSLAANLTQPIFQGGRLLAGIDQVKAETREALAEYVGLALEAFAEVENALEAERLLADREAHARRASREAEGAYRSTESDYRAGLAEFTAVLEAQRRYLETATEIPLLHRFRLENRVNLHLALGGDFSSLPPAREESS